MADQVTISTFLELKDNLSKGLKRLEGTLQAIAAAANKVNDALGGVAKTTAQMGAGTANATKIAVAGLREQAKAIRDAERLKMRQAREQARMTDFAYRQEQRRKMQSDRLALKELRDASKVAATKERLAQRTAERQAQAANQAAKAQERAARRQQVAAARAAKAQQAEALAKRRSTAQMAAVMFGPSIGTAIGAFGTPEFGVLAGIAALEGVFSVIRTSISATIDLLKSFNQKVFEAGREYQNTQLRIGMVLVGLNMAPTMRSAKLQADQLYSTMRVLARDLPGETQDYVEVFSRALPAALAAGEKNVKRFSKLASEYTAFAFFSGVKDVGQIGRDLEATLRGRAISRTRTFANLQPYMEKWVEAKDLKRLKPEERLKLVTDAVAKAAQGIGDSADTAEAKLGTLNDLITQIYQQGGKPLFDAQLNIITRINRYLIDNNTEINKTVGLIATGLGNALMGAVDKVMELAKNFGAIKEQMESLFTGLDVLALGGLATGVAAPIAGAYLGARVLYKGGAYLYGQAEEAGAAIRSQQEQERRQKMATAAEEIVKKYPGLAEKMPSKAAADEAKLKAWSQSLLREKKMPKAEWETFLQSQGIPLTTSREWFAELAARPPQQVGGAPSGRTSQNFDFKYSRFDIRQEFAEGFDPDRIAVAFASDLAKLGEMRTQAWNAPLFAVPSF